MKTFKFLTIVLILILFNTVSTNSFADECDEIKGNIAKKLFCKAKKGTESFNTGSSSSDSSTSTSVEATEEKKGILSKIWKRPEWTKRKKN